MKKVTMKDLKKEGKEKVRNLRKPVYQIGDGIVGVEDATRSLPHADNKIKILVSKLNSVHKELVNHLNANYLWD
jgi:hypothetical protein